MNPCLSESRRHTWEHVHDIELRRQHRTSIEFRMIGVYRCVTCLAVKRGRPHSGLGAALGIIPVPLQSPQSQDGDGPKRSARGIEI